MSICQCTCHTSNENFPRYISFLREMCCKCASREKAEETREQLEQRIEKLEKDQKKWFEIQSDNEKRFAYLKKQYTYLYAENEERKRAHNYLVDAFKNKIDDLKFKTDDVIKLFVHHCKLENQLLEIDEKVNDLENINAETRLIQLESLQQNQSDEPVKSPADEYWCACKCHKKDDQLQVGAILCCSSCMDNHKDKPTLTQAFEALKDFIRDNPEYIKVKPSSKTKTYWVNVYKYESGDLRMGYVWLSKEAAEQCDQMDDSFVKTISFEVENEI